VFSHIGHDSILIYFFIFIKTIKMKIKLYFYNIFRLKIFMQYNIHTFIKIENAFEKFYNGSCKVK